VSTEEQAKEGVSLDGQRRAIRERAGDDVRLFVDEGISGAKDDRPQYQALLAAAAAGELDTVYVWNLARLGRSTNERLRAWDALKDAGVQLVSLTEGAQEAKLVYTILAAVAEEERETIRRNTRMGLREAARQGRYPVGESPYGYRSVGEKRERRFIIDEAEAAVVRRIFDEYLAGVGVNRIAAGLNADGIRTRRGSKFSARSILAVLPNRTYLGEVVLQGEVMATGAHDPIIDAEVFAQAERLREARRSRPNGGRGRPPKRHLLDGLLTCANGHGMLARRWGHTEFYCCHRKHSYGDCDAPDANRRKVDETFLAHFLNRHFDEDAMLARLGSVAGEKVAEAQALAAAADREEQEAVVALTRIRRDYKSGKITAEQWQEFQGELEEEQAAARASADQLRHRAAEIEAEAGQVDVEAQLVTRLAQLMQTVAGRGDDAEAVNELRAALTATFEKVVYQPSWEDVPAGAPLVAGKVELAPVLRRDLLGANSTDRDPSQRYSGFDWADELLAPIPVAVT
jgi:DNA invertase Pin-like site-specific DNA recombinase